MRSGYQRTILQGWLPEAIDKIGDTSFLINSNLDKQKGVDNVERKKKIPTLLGFKTQ